MPTNEQIITDFEGAVWVAIEESTKTGYNPTGFKGMITTHGGVYNASRQLLVLNGLSEGIIKLWEMNRLDLSIEAIILRRCFFQIFTNDQLDTARRRLTELGFFNEHSYKDYIKKYYLAIQGAIL